jgi:CheY-like chemotaxis protein
MATNQQTPLILAIDPAPPILGLYDSMLTAAGYRTSTQTFATSGVNSAKALHPDLFILDGPWDQYGMGWDLLVGIQNDPATKSIPILLSTFTERQIVRRASTLQSMGVATLHKPFEQSGLLNAVTRLIPASG